MKKHVKKWIVGLCAALVLTMGCASMSMAGTNCPVGSTNHDCIIVSQVTMMPSVQENCSLPWHKNCKVTVRYDRQTTQCIKCGEQFWSDVRIELSHSSN